MFLVKIKNKQSNGIFTVQFSRSVVSDSLWPHGLQHARPPVHHQLLEFTQTHVHWDGDAIQPSHPLSSHSPPAFSFSQHQVWENGSVLPFISIGLFFTSGSQSIGVSASASAFPMNIQDWFPLGWTVWISLQFKGLSRVFSSTTVQKHQFFSTQLSL